MSAQQLPQALVLTNGQLHESDAKTAHGLIRGTNRFTIVALVDVVHAGKDAGEVLDGIHRNIPIYTTVADAVKSHPELSFCIVGVATVGGILSPALKQAVIQAIEFGLSAVNGLHDYLSEMDDVVALAKQKNVQLIDIRKPKKRTELHFWTGNIFHTKATIIAVLGMDCALGKRTTCRLVLQACQQAGISAQMIYTGQTGWLQGIKHGFIFDATLNDFISGEIEHAILSCERETNAQVILLEGQSALRNPSGPCGTEFLVSGNAKQVVLVHAPKRKHFDHIEAWGEIPTVASEIQLIEAYGAKVIALCINTEHCTLDEAIQFQQAYQKELGIPVLLPLEQGVQPIVSIIQQLIHQ